MTHSPIGKKNIYKNQFMSLMEILFTNSRFSISIAKYSGEEKKIENPF
jgi:hypothetical protein